VARDFSLLQKYLSGPGAHPPGVLPWEQSSQVVIVTPLPQLELMLRMSGGETLLPMYVFMAWTETVLLFLYTIKRFHPNNICHPHAL